MKALLELQYLPSIEYFCALSQCEQVSLEVYEHYVKQSFRNRCYINTANGMLKLVVPVTAKHGKALVKDVQIDYSTKWQLIHWRAIESGYRNAAYFDHYQQSLATIMFKKNKFLYDLNMELLSFCLQSVQFSTALTESKSYQKVPDNEIIDLRSVISAKIPYLERRLYSPSSYLQVFGNKFVPNLSVIDLLFCEGPNAIHIIKSSTRGYLNK